MKHYTEKEIKFYARLFEEFIDRDLPNSKLKARDYAAIAKERKDDAFYDLFRALEYDGPTRERKNRAIQFLKPWVKEFFHNPNMEFYIAYYSALLMATGDPKALATCDRILKSYPSSFQALTSKGIILSKKGKYFEAIDLFDKALEIRPNSAWVQKHKWAAADKIRSSKSEHIASTQGIDLEKGEKPNTKVKRTRRKFNQKVFMGHCGDESREVAELLVTFMKKIFPGLEDHYSENIPGGKKFFDIILKNLSECNCGVFCITKDNCDSPWIHFEAGALSIPISDDKAIIPFLFDIKDIKKKNGEDFASPLKGYQFAFEHKQGVLTLLKGINEKSEPKLSVKELTRKRDKHWSALNKGFIRIRRKYKL